MVNSQLMGLLTRMAEFNLKKRQPPAAACVTVDGNVKVVGVGVASTSGGSMANAMTVCFNKLRNRFPTLDLRTAVLYTTLSPGLQCVGAIASLGIREVVIGENTTFRGPEEMLRDRGVQIFNLESKRCIDLARRFNKRCPRRWKEYLGGA